MTPRSPEGEAWSDARLDTAFRAAFDAAPPTGLAERLDMELRTTRASGGLRLSIRQLGGLVAATAATVVLVIVGTQLRIAGPGATSVPSPSASVSAGPSSSGLTGFPANVTDPATGEVVPVIAVANAIAVRDRGADASEIAVKGWYEAFAVPCPMRPGVTARLEGCDLGFSWLLQDPESLSTTDPRSNGSIHAPAGPGINVLYEGNLPRSGEPAPVVFIGHFDDPGVAACLPANRQLCADRFVVDQLAFSEAPVTASDFPTASAGLPVQTVADAIAVRDAKDDGGPPTELAIAGWYQAPLASSFCALVPANPVPFLVGDCNLDQTWLMASPESLWTSDPGGSGSALSRRSPAGPAINVTFPGLTPPPPLPIPATGTSSPTPVVVVGHFHDRRSALCPPDRLAACEQRFVVDAVTWVDRNAATLPVFVDLDPNGTTLTTTQQAVVSDFVAAQAPLLQIIVGKVADIGRIQPGVTSSAGLTSEAALWVGTYVVAGSDQAPPTALTFLVDERGVLYRVTGNAVIRPLGVP